MRIDPDAWSAIVLAGLVVAALVTLLTPRGTWLGRALDSLAGEADDEREGGAGDDAGPGV